MKALTQLLSHESIAELALPSNLRYGREIYKRKAVKIINQSHLEIEGWVGGLSGKSAEGGGQRRRVRLSSTVKGLAWHCAGNPKNHQIFCKHCVAIALFYLQKT